MSLSQFMSCRLTRWLALTDSVSDATCLLVVVSVTYRTVLYVLSVVPVSYSTVRVVSCTSNL